MKRPDRTRLALVLALALAHSSSVDAAVASDRSPVLRASDVVFMYEGSRETYDTYEATVVAWGGTPSPASLAKAQGLRFFGSVGMVTEFGAYHRRNPERYAEGLCRDVDGQPVPVPWLVDHKSAGVPFWWCCTRQPLFREFLRERVVQIVKAGADGLHVDDHLGTAGGLWLGLCFCERCVTDFRPYLGGLPATELAALRVADPATFDFRAEALRWRAAAKAAGKSAPAVTAHPLWPHWTIYQCRAAAESMQELRDLAARTAGRPVPVGANAGLLWPRHLSDVGAVDLFSAETDHHARERKCSDLPLLAYRLAEAMGRPYAATASGGDWAFIKEHQLPGLVRQWIALSYAAGQRLMAPHHQWCHTAEKGTHWYDGPSDRFAPLYRFVRTNAVLFDDFRTHADLTILMPHGSFARQPGRWFSVAQKLAAAQIPYRLIVAGDAIVDQPLNATELAATGLLLTMDTADLLPPDRQLLADHARQRPPLASLEEALTAVQPAVRLREPAPVRLLPRVKPGSAVVHVLNLDYQADRDLFRPCEPVRLALDLTALGVPDARHVRVVQPAGESVTLRLDGGRVDLPRLELWALVVLENDSAGKSKAE